MTVIIIVGIIALIIVYMLMQRGRREQQTLLMAQQVALIEAQTAQQQACDQSWQCSATNILSGVGDVLGGFFGGSN